jgi:hypothetical protein
MRLLSPNLFAVMIRLFIALAAASLVRLPQTMHSRQLSWFWHVGQIVSAKLAPSATGLLVWLACLRGSPI